VSHSRIHEDAQGGGSDESRKGKRSGKKENQSSTMAIPVMEKTTLGDIEELAALKEKLDNQKVAAFKKEAKAKANKEEEAKVAEAEVKDEPKIATEAEETVENKTEETKSEE
ncbi:MAG TPA: 30S ribosomal protein S1, partial [Porphyromonadaceae bacterium]|nr:30S ribosomal protein S1 [Porphyromonadaceae bacterium]HBK93653.1 30S ribosomal protein S1 [Porphyromonadaceae bacterium]